MNPTVSHCLFVHNDLPMLKATLMYDKKWVDQTCILDLGSTDGTEEFCKMYLGPNDVYQRRETNTCPELGFGEARTASMRMATCDWIYSSGASCMLAPDNHGEVRDRLSRLDADVGQIRTFHIPPFGECYPAQIERAIINCPRPKKMEHHRVFVRNGRGVEFKGYIHEEPYRGETNCHEEARSMMVSRIHFEGWGNNEMRGLRYAWMIVNAVKNPELKKYTNKWWYEVYFPKHSTDLLLKATMYEERVRASGIW